MANSSRPFARLSETHPRLLDQIVLEFARQGAPETLDLRISAGDVVRREALFQIDFEHRWSAGLR